MSRTPGQPAPLQLEPEPGELTANRRQTGAATARRLRLDRPIGWRGATSATALLYQRAQQQRGAAGHTAAGRDSVGRGTAAAGGAGASRRPNRAHTDIRGRSCVLAERNRCLKSPANTAARFMLFPILEKRDRGQTIRHGYEERSSINDRKRWIFVRQQNKTEHPATRDTGSCQISHLSADRQPAVQAAVSAEQYSST